MAGLSRADFQTIKGYFEASYGRLVSDSLIYKVLKSIRREYPHVAITPLNKELPEYIKAKAVYQTTFSRLKSRGVERETCAINARLEIINRAKKEEYIHGNQLKELIANYVKEEYITDRRLSYWHERAKVKTTSNGYYKMSDAANIVFFAIRTTTVELVNRPVTVEVIPESSPVMPLKVMH
jgi:hypothetical protein